MKVNRIILVLSILLMALLTGACNRLQSEVVETEDVIQDQLVETETPEAIQSDEEVQPTASQESSSKRRTFGQLGISMEVPAELYVQKDPLINLNDPSKLEGYLFYIQNYGYPGASSSGDFQMYGHLQFFPGLEPISWDEFANNTINSPMNAYANEIKINGLRGFDTQLSGERNRFVYLFYLDQHIFSIAVSAPTPENKAKADQIISTLEYTPGGLTDASGVQLISEPNGYYQMYIPDDWDFTFNTTAGIRLSDLEASSPDVDVVVEETDGPHSNIYYKNGLVMNFVVLEDDSAKSEPNMAIVHRKESVMIYGIEATDYLFVEPSTAEGELREIRFYYDGRSYLVRFGYPLDTDTDEINWIIRNLLITE